jgi:hypothetical protein
MVSAQLEQVIPSTFQFTFLYVFAIIFAGYKFTADRGAKRN